LYSWGDGVYYKLATREEENLFEPGLVHPKMFFDGRIFEVGCGSQHVVVLAGASPDDMERPQLDFSLPLPMPEPVEEVVE
jgi:hypothetical protein